jgi:hypothetical protein
MMLEARIRRAEDLEKERKRTMRAEKSHTEGARTADPTALSGLMALLVLGGCVGLGGDRVLVQGLEHEVAGASCDKTLDEAWDEARRLLDERGYELAGADARAVGKAPGVGSYVGPFGSLFTPAKQTKEEGANRVLETGWRGGQRYRLEGAPEATGCHVAFLTVAEDPGQRGRDAWQAPRRDASLELELLRRLAPEEAARIDGLARHE